MTLKLFFDKCVRRLTIELLLAEMLFVFIKNLMEETSRLGQDLVSKKSWTKKTVLCGENIVYSKLESSHKLLKALLLLWLTASHPSQHINYEVSITK